MVSVKSVAPPAPHGSYWVTLSGTDQFPDDGHGLDTATAGDAIWADQALGATDFEVIIESIVATTANTSVIISEITGSGTYTLQSPATFGQVVTGIKVPMRGGFSATTANGAVEITFRICRYMS